MHLAFFTVSIGRYSPSHMSFFFRFSMPNIDVSRLSVVAMTGATIAIDDASAGDSIRSVKQRVFAANRKLHVRRQRLVYRPGRRGMEALEDDETLGGAGVARDGSAELDLLLAEEDPLPPLTLAELGPKVLCLDSTAGLCHRNNKNKAKANQNEDCSCDSSALSILCFSVRPAECSF